MADSSREIDDQVDFEDDNYEEEMDDDDDVEEQLDEANDDDDGNDGEQEDSEDDRNRNRNRKQNVVGEGKLRDVGDGNDEKHAELLALPPHGSEIFIGGLSRDVFEEDLSELCEPFGDIVEVSLSCS